jgi:hypothetical protein
VVEEDHALGRVVVEDFTRARVLDRLLLYERRIESSLYRTMAELRQKQEARQAREATARDTRSRSECRVQTGQESVIPAQLGSFGANTVAGGRTLKVAFGSRETPAGIARGTGRRPVVENHGRDAHATERPDGVTTNPVAHHSSIPSFHPWRPVPEAPAEGQACETKPIGEVPSAKCQVSSERGQTASPPSPPTSDFTLYTSTSAGGRSCETKPKESFRWEV